jgi:AsmA family protein
VSHFFATHPKTTWIGIAAASVIALLVAFLLFFDWNHFRPTLAGMISTRTGRPTSIQGDLKVHLWSWNPSAEVGGLTLRNPSWAQRDVMFSAKQLTVSVSLGRLLRGQLVLPQVLIVQPTIDLERDAKGRPSWELGEPNGAPKKTSEPAKLPTIQSLVIQNGDVRVTDRIRKLILSGSLTAADRAGKDDPEAFKVRLTGTLNAKPFQTRITGGPLVNLTPDRPYSLDAHITASDIKLDARATFPKPFDLSAYDARFDLSGKDLADVYYLTGLALPNTPAYQLAADLHHSGNAFRIENLKGRVGSSDLEGSVEITTGHDRPKLEAKIRSTKLDITDLAPTLGQPNGNTGPPLAQNGAGKASSRVSDSTPAASPALAAELLPDADLQVDRVRGMDADVTYHAESVTAPRLPMQKVNFRLTLNNGLLNIDPLSFVLDQGRFAGGVRVDARNDNPETTIDMTIDDVNLAQFKTASQKQAPIQGSLEGRIKLHGFGTSVHKLASTADGGISMAIPDGQINEVIAELTGIDTLRGLGLILSQNENQTRVRCGVIDFEADKGVLNSKTVFIDTTNVLITGRGHINLQDERLDLAIQGDPKKLRFLRIRSPITLQGTLKHPAVGVKAEKLAAQVGVAAALGVLLTPVASALAFIDPGLAKDKNCSAVLAQAEQDVPQAGPLPSEERSSRD